MKSNFRHIFILLFFINGTFKTSSAQALKKVKIAKMPITILLPNSYKKLRTIGDDQFPFSKNVYATYLISSRNVLSIMQSYVDKFDFKEPLKERFHLEKESLYSSGYDKLKLKSEYYNTKDSTIYFTFSCRSMRNKTIYCRNVFFYRSNKRYKFKLTYDNIYLQEATARKIINSIAFIE